MSSNWGKHVKGATWNSQRQKIIRAISDLKNLAPGDRSRELRIQEICKKVSELLDESQLPDRPQWVDKNRAIPDEMKEHSKLAAPVVAAIRELTEQETGRRWGDDLHIGSSVGMKSFRFDVWYKTDEELSRDRSSGRQAEISGVIQRITRRVANASSTVYFHSHQYIQERCGGDYSSYLR